MGFATGFVTGLAKSVDKQLQNSMLRTQKRMDGMEQYRVTRKRAEIDRQNKETRDVADLIDKFAASYTNGDLDYAEQIFVAAGGNVKDASEYYDVLKKNEKVSKDFRIIDHVKFGERVRGEDVTSAQIAANYIRGVDKYTDYEPVNGVGLMAAIGDGNYGQKINANVEQQVPTPENLFGQVKRTGAKLNHSNLIDYKAYEKDNLRELGANFEQEVINLNREIAMATGEEKKELIKQRDDYDNRIIAKANAKKSGTGVKSIFSKEGITKVIDSTIKGAVSNEYTETVGDIVKILINGNEGPVFEQKNNGIKALEKKYSSVSKASEPILWNGIGAEKQLQRQERNTYIGKQYQKHLSVEEGSTYEKYQTFNTTAQKLPSFNATDGTSAEDAITQQFQFEKKELRNLAIKESYPPGKVID